MKSATEKKLGEMTRSRGAQIAFLLAFIEQAGLTDLLNSAIEAEGCDAVPEDLEARFLLDVDVLMSDACELAQERAKRVVQFGGIALSEHYVNHRTDYTLAKHFMSALSKEIDFQFRPLNDTKESRALITRIASVI